MKRIETANNTVQSTDRKFLRAFSSVLLVLSLGLGSGLLSGCVAVPALMLTSATVTAAGVATEGERFVQMTFPEGEGSCAVAENDKDARDRPAEACQPKGTLQGQGEPGVHELPKEGNHSSADPNEPESVG